MLTSLPYDLLEYILLKCNSKSLCKIKCIKYFIKDINFISKKICNEKNCNNLLFSFKCWIKNLNYIEQFNHVINIYNEYEFSNKLNCLLDDSLILLHSGEYNNNLNINKRCIILGIGDVTIINRIITDYTNYEDKKNHSVELMNDDSIIDLIKIKDIFTDNDIKLIPKDNYVVINGGLYNGLKFKNYYEYTYIEKECSFYNIKFYNYGKGDESLITFKDTEFKLVSCKTNLTINVDNSSGIIYNCNFCNQFSSGIICNDSVLEIFHNRFNNCDIGIEIINNNNISIRDNLINDNNYGITIHESNVNIISNNIYENINSGILYTGTKNNININNNLIKNNKNHITSFLPIDILQNNFTNNYESIFKSNEHILKLSNNIYNNKIILTKNDNVIITNILDIYMKGLTGFANLSGHWKYNAKIKIIGGIYNDYIFYNTSSIINCKNFNLL